MKRSLTCICSILPCVLLLTATTARVPSVSGAAYGNPILQFSDSEERIAWIREKAIPFATTEPGRGFRDLETLKELVGEARLVALGEGTHGTHEFFRLKHRIVEFLATEMGFTVFSIEANMPEAYRVNEFVLNGEGDPKELLKEMSAIWNAQEVLDMILWMREFNKSSGSRIEFTGFDMQSPKVAIENVTDALANLGSDYIESVQQIYSEIKRAHTPSVRIGVLAGRFPHSLVAGKRIRYSGYVKTEGVEKGWAGLWWRADGLEDSATPLVFDNMETSGPRGTSPWTQYFVDLLIPDEVTNINFGVIMSGTGTAWFDGLSVEIEGEEYKGNLSWDLDFEDGTLEDAWTGGEGYDISIETQEVYSGSHSLGISYVEDNRLDKPIGNPEELVEQSRRVIEHLESFRSEYASKAQSEKLEWVIQNARIVHQSLVARIFWGQPHRDSSMAENVRWILEHSPESAKIILWAHNGHVAKQKPWMGGHLAEWYGDDMVVLPMTTHQGKYAAGSDQGLGIHDLAPSEPGSLEYDLHQASLPHYILDLRDVPLNLAASAWLAQPLSMRSIGFFATQEQFSPHLVEKWFDAIVFIDETTESRLLRD